MEKSAADRKVIQDTLSEHYVFSDLAAKPVQDDNLCSATDQMRTPRDQGHISEPGRMPKKDFLLERQIPLPNPKCTPHRRSLCAHATLW